MIIFLKIVICLMGVFLLGIFLILFAKLIFQKPSVSPSKRSEQSYLLTKNSVNNELMEFIVNEALQNIDKSASLGYYTCLSTPSKNLSDAEFKVLGEILLNKGYKVYSSDHKNRTNLISWSELAVYGGGSLDY